MSAGKKKGKATTPPAAKGPAMIWDSESLLAKAISYADEMQECESDDWKRALWSTLTLELLARAALAKVSPTLLADSKDWNNLYHALGRAPVASKFVPRSISTTEVLDRLGDIYSDFDKELRDFCKVHISRRNAELHSAETPFQNVGHDAWLPQLYRACQALLKSMDSDLEKFLGKEGAKIAEKQMAAALDVSAKAVAGQIKAFETVWENTSEKERKKLIAQAALWSSRHEGHRVLCPACKSDALVFGEPIAPAKKKMDGDLITESQEYLPSRFECVACRLKISGLSQLNACSLGNVFKSTHTYDAADYYAPPPDEFDGYEEDNNEPV